MYERKNAISNVALKETKKLDISSHNISLAMMPVIDTMNKFEKIQSPFVLKNGILNDKIYRSIEEQNLLVGKIIGNIKPLINQFDSIYNYNSAIKSIEALNNSVVKSLYKLDKDKISYLEFGFPSIAIDNISQLCESYNNVFGQSFLGRTIENSMILNYIDFQNNLISKIDYINIEKMSVLQNFYSNIATDVFYFQSNTFDSFKKIGVIEQRALSSGFKEAIDSNLYGKIAQSISNTYKSESKIEPEEVFDNSLVSNIYSNAKSIINNILQVNKLSQLKGECIFKPTPEMMNICVNFPTIITDNEEKFKSIIDWLYKSFWENRDRIIPLTSTDSIKFIDNLRKYFFHDLEHSYDGKAKKKYLNVGNFFNSIIGKSYPSNGKEWQQVQNHIYTILGQTLEEIKTKL